MEDEQCEGCAHPQALPQQQEWVFVTAQSPSPTDTSELKLTTCWTPILAVDDLGSGRRPSYACPRPTFASAPFRRKDSFARLRATTSVYPIRWQ